MPDKKDGYKEYIEKAFNSLPVLRNKCEIIDKNGHRWYMELAEVEP